ncbi:Calcium-activated potassium channel slowpoke [Lamellibrachia satsuma]|nr:Calcium-activated potassium channel slowpoke [Lamellibrachia satsuma]
MTSCIHFLVNATRFSVDDCGPIHGDVSENIWLAMCCVFVCYYIVKFAAATDKLAMWTGINSIVDHFTILPSFVGLYFNVNWLGLRFLRLLHILQVTDILQLTHVIKSSRHIRVVQVVTLLVGVWLSSAGFIHLTENNGDPFGDDDKAQHLTYWECVYWLLITMSTVGYGDISPQTNTSRAFIIVFIMGTIAMFASVIPELVSAMASTNKYAKPYKRTYGKKHIVVCGHITYESVTPFLKNFVHADTKAKTRDIHVVLLGRNCNEITFIEGSAMDSASLQNVKLAHADACVILANRKASDADEADAETLMRVTAVKNYRPHIRVIVQLRQYHNKGTVPANDENNDDDNDDDDDDDDDDDHDNHNTTTTTITTYGLDSY